MRTLLTGASGFIGTVMQEYIDVIPLDKPDDILTADLPEVDQVIHLAALAGVRDSFDKAQDYWETNVKGTQRILDFYKDKRVVVASSSNAAFPYSNPYAMSKYVAEQIPHDNCLHMRFTTVYGRDSREGMFFWKLLNNQLEYTTTHIRDFIHVDDLCPIVVNLLASDRTGIANLGTGTGVRVCDLAPDIPVKDGYDYEVLDNVSSEVWPQCRTVWEYLQCGD